MDQNACKLQGSLSRKKFIEPAKTDWSQDKTVLVSSIVFVYV